MELTTGLVFVIVFLISYYIFTKSKNLPPGPVGLPVFGNLFLVNKFRHQRPQHVLFEAAKKYGNVMSFSVGKRLIVVITGYDVVHEALVKQADVFSDRPTNRLTDKGVEGASEFQDRPEFLEKIKNGGVVHQKYGNLWRTMRRFTLQSLRDFGVGKTSLEEKIFTEIEVVSKAFEESESLPISTTNYTQKLIGNVLHGIVFGKRYEYDDPEFTRIRNMLSSLFTGNKLASVGQILPNFLAKLISEKDIETENIKLRSRRQVRKYIADQIKEHETTFDKDNIRDFVDIYLQTKQESGSENDDIDIANMFRMIMDLFVAGSETTYNTLDWALLYMSEFTEIQAKCQKEIQEVFGERQVQYSDRGKVPYLEATLMEIQRFSMIAPFALVHCTTRDTTLCGYHIPAGTSVLPSLYSVSNDPKYWKQPEKFMPERFLNDSGKLVKNEAFMPFSTGPRVCLGEPLAKMELFLVFSNLLQRFSFKRENKNISHSLKPKLYNATNAPTPYRLRVCKTN